MRKALLEALLRAGSWPRRWAIRRRIDRTLAGRTVAGPTVPGTVVGLICVKNEDFWVETVVRTACKVLPRVLVVDSGSTDRTLSILSELQAERLPFELFRHGESRQGVNVAANRILERASHEEYFLLIDGDELHTEASLAAVQAQVLNQPAKSWKLDLHVLFSAPDDVLRCTPRGCAAVRHLSGRGFWRELVRLDEIYCAGGMEPVQWSTVAALGPGTAVDGSEYIHVCMLRRSTDSTWRGYGSIMDAAYRRRYTAAPEQYVPTPYFPKEIGECRWSAHNPYIAQVLESGLPLR